MIYILKFIAAFLLPPGLFVLLGVILSTYLWRKRQHFGCLAFSLSAFLTLLLYFSSTLLGAKLLGQPLENRYSQQQPYAAQVIVVLGGGSVGSVPDGAERGGLMSAGAARLLTAARLAKQHSLPVLISGGQVFSDGVSEALVAEPVFCCSWGCRRSRLSSKRRPEQRRKMLPILLRSAMNVAIKTCCC